MRSNFEIGRGGGTISVSILGGHKTLFLPTLYNFKNIGGVTCSPPYSVVPGQGDIIIVIMLPGA